MTAPDHPAARPPLDLSRWQSLPNRLVGVGGGLALIGLVLGVVNGEYLKEFGYAWLLAFMFYLSLCLGGMFLVLMHHLFDASWSVPIRRFCEHLAALSGVWLPILFLPVALLAPRLYPWMTLDPHADHALHAKQPMFTLPMFYVITALCFGCWWLFSSQLRSWSLRQDETGGAECTHAMRRWASIGIFVFAITLTIAAIMWMKALQHQFFSTMYGVYYFAGSVWMTLATVYLITVFLERQGSLRGVVHSDTYYYIGSLLLAFTVFYAYIHFSQYFIIWNANVPEETFWYKVREQGTWWDVGMIIIFGHFFVPFLALLRIDAKLYLPLMAFLGVWAWLNHFCDLAFNILPVPHPDDFPLQWLWLYLGCLAFMGGVLARAFLKRLNSHPPFPLRDPRLAESLGVYVPPASAPLTGGSK